MTRLAVVTDKMSDSRDEEEYRDIRHFLDPIVPDLRLVHRGHDYAAIPGLDVDLLVVDFGGLVQSYGSAADDWSRTLLRYAEDHPSTLVLIWGSFGADYLHSAMQEWQGKGYGEDPDWPVNLRSMYEMTAPRINRMHREADGREDYRPRGADSWDLWLDASVALIKVMLVDERGPVLDED